MSVMTKERNVLSELLEIVFHYILYVRKIYPENIFEKRTKCHLLMWKCVHPEVCNYISNFLLFLEKFLGDEPSLDVALILIGKTGEISEEYVFEINYLNQKDEEKAPTNFKLEEWLSSIAFALTTISCSKSNCHGITFELQIRSNCTMISKEDIEVYLKNEKFPWTAVEEPETGPWFKINPLHTLSHSDFKKVTSFKNLAEEWNTEISKEPMYRNARINLPKRPGQSYHPEVDVSES